MIARLNSSMFIGADPSIGVAVLRRTKQQTSTANSMEKSAKGLPMLGGIEEYDDDEASEIQPVELFYS